MSTKVTMQSSKWGQLNLSNMLFLTRINISYNEHGTLDKFLPKTLYVQHIRCWASYVSWKTLHIDPHWKYRTMMIWSFVFSKESVIVNFRIENVTNKIFVYQLRLSRRKPTLIDWKVIKRLTKYAHNRFCIVLSSNPYPSSDIIVWCNYIIFWMDNMNAKQNTDLHGFVHCGQFKVASSLSASNCAKHSRSV